MPYPVSIFSVRVRPAEDVAAADRPRPTFDVLRADGSILASGPRGAEIDAAGASAAREVLFPSAGTYYLRVSNTAGGVAGPASAYELRATLGSFVVNADLAAFPVEQSGTITPPATSVGAHIPRFTKFLAAGSRFTTSVTAAGLPTPSALDLRLSIYDVTDHGSTGAADLVASNDDRSAGNRDPSVEWTVPRTGQYLFVLDWAGPAGAGHAFQLTLGCAPGHFAFSEPGDPLRSPLCLPVAATEAACAPALPAFAAARPNLLQNGSFETTPPLPPSVAAPPGWQAVNGSPYVYDTACAEQPSPADCYSYPPSFFAAAAAPSEGRRFIATGDGQGLAQAVSLTPGRSYQLRAFIRSSPAPANPARGALRAYLGDSVDAIDDETAAVLGHFCATPGSGAFVERAVTFTAPAGADTLPLLLLVGMPIYTTDALFLAVDAVSLIDVTP